MHDVASFYLYHSTYSSHLGSSWKLSTLIQIYRHRSRPSCHFPCHPYFRLPLRLSSSLGHPHLSFSRRLIPSPRIASDSCLRCLSSHCWSSSGCPRFAVWSSCCSCFDPARLLRPAQAVHADSDRNQPSGGVDCLDQGSMGSGKGSTSACHASGQNGGSLRLENLLDCLNLDSVAPCAECEADAQLLERKRTVHCLRCSLCLSVRRDPWRPTGRVQ